MGTDSQFVGMISALASRMAILEIGHLGLNAMATDSKSARFIRSSFAEFTFGGFPSWKQCP